MPTEAQWNGLPALLAKKKPQLALKRLLDVVVSLLGLLVLSPILLLCALLVRVDSPGPCLFRQTRVGRGGKNFEILKFRTMVTDAQALGPQLTARGDSRITRVGRVLRKAKLDELPQLANVLLGDMSLVGPRPEVPRYVAHYTSGQRKVLLVRPGITDPASIVYRNENDLLDQHSDRESAYVKDIMPKKLALNYYYIRHLSVPGDLLLVIKTILAVAGVPVRVQGKEEAA